MSEFAIQAAFDAFLGPRVPDGMPVAWEEVPFTPPPSAPWLATRMSSRVSRSVGPGRDTVTEYAGSYQISVYFPSGQGVYPVSRKAVEISELFPRGLTLNAGNGLAVHVLNATLPPAISQPGWIMVPVQINWVSYKVPS